MEKARGETLWDGKYRDACFGREREIFEMVEDLRKVQLEEKRRVRLGWKKDMRY